MSRATEAALAELLAHLPSGWAWDKAPAGGLAGLLRPVAERMAGVEADAEAMLAEVNPRRAATLLPDFERVLGPDPCGRDLLISSLGDRQAFAHQRWTAAPQPTPAAIVKTAADLGVAITIEEFVPPQVGVAECGAATCSGDAEVFVWIVQLPATRVIETECAVTECGDWLGEVVPAGVECVIRQMAPAHTVPVFAYS